jgi:hypothetical protein
VQVYGEFKFPIISDMIKNVPITENDSFIDLGSGMRLLPIAEGSAGNSFFSPFSPAWWKVLPWYCILLAYVRGKAYVMVTLAAQWLLLL